MANILNDIIEEFYKRNEKFKLEETYLEKGINLNECDNEFSRYGLLKYVEYHEILKPKDFRIYDSRIDKTIGIKLDKRVFELFYPYILDNSIKSIAFRPDYNNVISGKNESSNIFEAIEYGKAFDLHEFSNIPVTKLIDYNNDSLWIKIENERKWITIEELIDDIKNDDNSNVITQLVHLEYYIEADQCYIVHIDHEFIFYSLDEYMNRLNNNNQKGTSKAREKSFKIDKSKIPLYNAEGQNVLVLLIEILFTNQNLFKEYFGII
ncbi:MAG: hypothetical protein AB9836_05225 [Aminipila sp.]